jgi:hypothetical protein
MHRLLPSNRTSAKRRGRYPPAALGGGLGFGRASQVLVAADEMLVKDLDEFIGLDPAQVTGHGLLPLPFRFQGLASGEEVVDESGPQFLPRRATAQGWSVWSRNGPR